MATNQGVETMAADSTAEAMVGQVMSAFQEGRDIDLDVDRDLRQLDPIYQWDMVKYLGTTITAPETSRERAQAIGHIVDRVAVLYPRIESRESYIRLHFARTVSKASKERIK